MKKNNSFIGVILAAGLGSRLRPLTNKIPKCLIKTAGKEILQYQIDSYVKAGIKKLIIITGYESSQIKNFVKNNKDLNIKLIVNDDYEVTNNMYSFYLAIKEIKGKPFILNNADLAIDKNIIGSILNHPSESGVAIDNSFFSKESMKVIVNLKGYISDISKKISKMNSNGNSIDFYKFSKKDGQIFIKEVKKIIEKEKNFKDWTEVALQRLFKLQILKFKGINIFGKNWVEIDNYEDLAISDRKFSGFDKKFKEINTIFLDLDGTLFVGDSAIPNVAKTIDHLRRKGKKIFFLSNNSSKNKLDYVKKLSKFNIKSKQNEIILSSDAVIDYLLNKKIKQVYVLGTKSFKKIIAEKGIKVNSSSPEYVVVGYDTEMNYKKLVLACSYINKGVEIIATHRDVSCPSKFGPIPDIGSIIELLKKTTGKSPIKIFGKPDKLMVLNYFKTLKIKPSKSLIIGDRLNTDILMAKEVGSNGMLVLTGDTKREMCQYSNVKPDFILDSVASIHDKYDVTN
jgi:HAD superfamily hydrolase (TIGR01450 family)